MTVETRPAGTLPAETLRRSPLGHLVDVFAERSTSAVRLREIPFLTQLDVQADPAGTPLPTVPNTVADVGAWRALWLGPQEWLVVGPDGSAGEAAALFRAEGASLVAASVVNVSANRTTLELAGPAAREVLEKGCSLDLHPRVFGPGRCAQTLLSKVNVVLHQIDSEPCYRLLVRGSFAQYLADWLLDAMAEFR